MVSAVLVILGGYLLGSVSTAIIVCRALKLPDPRSEGSRNPGATNVLRIGGKKAAALTLIGDFLKGLLPVLLAVALGLPPFVVAITGIAAFLGHLFPLFFGFKGGKGVATALGVLGGFSWLLGLAVALTWLIVAKGFRVSSLSALIASALAPVYAWLLGSPPPQLAAVIVLVAFIFWRHRSNIQRLIDGTEGRIGR